MNELTGLNKLQMQLLLLSKIDLTEEVIEGMKIIEEESRNNCPVGEGPNAGNLRDSHETLSTGKNEAEVRVNAEYASYVEYGTSKMEAQPFLRPAIESKRKEVMEKIAEGLNDKLEEISNGR